MLTRPSNDFPAPYSISDHFFTHCGLSIAWMLMAAAPATSTHQQTPLLLNCAAVHERETPSISHDVFAYWILAVGLRAMNRPGDFAEGNQGEPPRDGAGSDGYVGVATPRTASPAHAGLIVSDLHSEPPVVAFIAHDSV